MFPGLTGPFCHITLNDVLDTSVILTFSGLTGAERWRKGKHNSAKFLCIHSSVKLKT